MSRARKKRQQKIPQSSAGSGLPKPLRARSGSAICPPWLAGTLIVASLLAGIIGGLLTRQARLASSVSKPNTDATIGPITEHADKSKSSSGANKGAAASVPTSATSPPAVSTATTDPNTPRPPSDPAVRQQIEQQFGPLFRDGYAHFQAERFTEAAQSFDRATQLAPYLPEGHYFLGRTYHSLVLPGKAEKCYRLALALDPDFAPAQEKIVVLLHERGAYREALTVLERMVAKSPRDTFVLGELGINHLALEDPATARKYMEQYVAIQGNRDAWGQAQLGRIHEALGDDQQARSLYESAIQINPNFGLAHHWLGLLLGRKGDTERSQQAFARYDELRHLENDEHQLRMAVINAPTDVAAILKLAQIRWRLGRQKEAIETLDKAKQLSPTHPGVLQLSRQWSQSQ